METFFGSLAVLIISGLGFITYQHPATGRKLANYILGVATLLIFLVNAFDLGQTKAYRAAFRAIEYLPPEISKDSLGLINRDSLMQDVEIKAAQSKLYYQKIAKSENEWEDTYGVLIISWTAVFIGYFIVIGLSILFEDLHKKKNKSPDN